MEREIGTRERPGPYQSNGTMPFVAFDPKDTRNLVIALGLGAAAGAAIIQSHHDEAAKSQAEKDDEAGCEWLCDLIWDFLDHWESEPCESEDITPTTSWTTYGMRCSTCEPGR